MDDTTNHVKDCTCVGCREKRKRLESKRRSRATVPANAAVGLTPMESVQTVLQQSLASALRTLRGATARLSLSLEDADWLYTIEVVRSDVDTLTCTSKRIGRHKSMGSGMSGSRLGLRVPGTTGIWIDKPNTTEGSAYNETTKCMERAVQVNGMWYYALPNPTFLADKFDYHAEQSPQDAAVLDDESRLGVDNDNPGKDDPT